MMLAWWRCHDDPHFVAPSSLFLIHFLHPFGFFFRPSKRRWAPSVSPSFTLGVCRLWQPHWGVTCWCGTLPTVRSPRVCHPGKPPSSSSSRCMGSLCWHRLTGMQWAAAQPQHPACRPGSKFNPSAVKRGDNPWVLVDPPAQFVHSESWKVYLSTQIFQFEIVEKVKVSERTSKVFNPALDVDMTCRFGLIRIERWGGVGGPSCFRGAGCWLTLLSDPKLSSFVFLFGQNIC